MESKGVKGPYLGHPLNQVWDTHYKSSLQGAIAWVSLIVFGCPRFRAPLDGCPLLSWEASLRCRGKRSAKKLILLCAVSRFGDMSRKESVFRELERRFSFLQNAGVQRIAVFGSVVREEDTEESDVDLLVEFAPGMERFRNLNAVCDILDEVFGDRYDLVTSGGLSPYLGPKILEEAEYVEAAS